MDLYEFNETAGLLKENLEMFYNELKRSSFKFADQTILVTAFVILFLCSLK